MDDAGRAGRNLMRAAHSLVTGAFQGAKNITGKAQGQLINAVNNTAGQLRATGHRLSKAANEDEDKASKAARQGAQRLRHTLANIKAAVQQGGKHRKGHRSKRRRTAKKHRRKCKYGRTKKGK